MVVRMRHTRAHTKNRRSHHALKDIQLSVCGSCSAQKLRHKVCMACGMYRGKQMIDVSQREARAHARRDRKEKALSAGN